VLAKLDIALQQAVANKEVSGVIGFIHHKGERGYFEAFGWQEIEAQKSLPKDALFRLQSMTKPVIAACAMSLFDAGLFTLDEPISKHCPEWAEPKVLENGQLVPAKFAITPRMLMSHSSGLYYGDIEKGALSKKGNEGATFTPVATTNRGAKTTLKDFSEGLAKAPLKFHPGTGWQYGHSIDVLGRYIEAVAGQPLDAPRERAERQRVRDADAVSLLGVVRHEAAHVVHGYRIRRKLGEVVEDVLRELWGQPRAGLVYLDGLREAAVADAPAAGLDARFRVHDMRQILYVRDLLEPCLWPVAAARLHAPWLRVRAHA
jgi:hypothetical protein